MCPCLAAAGLRLCWLLSARQLLSFSRRLLHVCTDYLHTVKQHIWLEHIMSSNTMRVHLPYQRQEVASLTYQTYAYFWTDAQCTTVSQ